MTRPHPGEVEPGQPGATRYLCPLCDWYVDFPPPDAADARIPAGSRPANIGELVRLVLEVRIAEEEAAIREHMVEVHTAPVILEG